MIYTVLFLLIICINCVFFIYQLLERIQFVQGVVLLADRAVSSRPVSPRQTLKKISSTRLALVRCDHRA